MSDQPLLSRVYSALNRLLEEYRALDLPYGSKAYAEGNDVLEALRIALGGRPTHRIQREPYTAWRFTAGAKDKLLRGLAKYVTPDPSGEPGVGRSNFNGLRIRVVAPGEIEIILMYETEETFSVRTSLDFVTGSDVTVIGGIEGFSRIDVN